MSIQAYDINLGPAGSNTATQIIEATAQICDFLSSGSAFDQIEVRPNFTQGVATLKLGQGFDFGAPVDRWLIVNKGTTAISGQIILSTAGFRNFRISGDVNVLDGGKSRTLNNSAYAAYASIAAVAGQVGRIQIWNPAANPNRLVVEAVTILGVASQTGVVTIQNAALATQLSFGTSKKAGGTNSLATMQSDTTAAAFALQGAMLGMAAPAGASPGFKFNEPVVILPGFGLTFWSSTANTLLGVGFEWYEEPNT